MADGRKVATAEQWMKERRPELVRLFEDHVYGKVPRPQKPIHLTSQVRSEDREALAGRADPPRNHRSRFPSKPDGPRIDLLLYLPKLSGAAAPRVRHSWDSTSTATTPSRAIQALHWLAAGCPMIQSTV